MAGGEKCLWPLSRMLTKRPEESGPSRRRIESKVKRMEKKDHQEWMENGERHQFDLGDIPDAVGELRG